MLENDNRQLEGRRKSITTDYTETQEKLAVSQAELARTQAALQTTRKELEDARATLAALPTLETKVQYLEADLKLKNDKATELHSTNSKLEQELGRTKVLVETLRVEKDATEKRLTSQLAYHSDEMEALRARDQDRAIRDEELANLRLEASVLRKEKEQWTDDQDADAKRWAAELEALRAAKEQQFQLQGELSQKAMELEVMKAGHRHSLQVQQTVVAKSAEAEVRNQVEETALRETVRKLKDAAPTKLKELREERDRFKAQCADGAELKEQLAKACAELDMYRAKYGGNTEKFLVTV
jgi:chromosome segregation ATPase